MNKVFVSHKGKGKEETELIELVPEFHSVKEKNQCKRAEVKSICFFFPLE